MKCLDLISFMTNNSVELNRIKQKKKKNISYRFSFFILIISGLYNQTVHWSAIERKSKHARHWCSEPQDRQKGHQNCSSWEGRFDEFGA